MSEVLEIDLIIARQKYPLIYNVTLVITLIIFEESPYGVLEIIIPSTFWIILSHPFLLY